MNNKSKIALGAGTGIFFLLLLGFFLMPNEGPIFGRFTTNTVSSCTATTSPAYMALAKGSTTTLAVPGGASVVTVDFFTQATTSASPQLGYRFESSEDGIDWYATGIETNANASTTSVAPLDYTITLASSTIGSSAFAAPTSTVYVQTPEYSVNGHQARVVFFMRNSAANVCATVLSKSEVE